jgi:hypothetical protein
MAGSGRSGDGGDGLLLFVFVAKNDVLAVGSSRSVQLYDSRCDLHSITMMATTLPARDQG